MPAAPFEPTEVKIVDRQDDAAVVVFRSAEGGEFPMKFQRPQLAGLVSQFENDREDCVHHMHGDADGARLVTDRAADGCPAHALRHRHAHRKHAGSGRPAILVDARALQADRGQGAEEAEAPEPIKDSQKLPR
jgi:hypothetical protein